MFNIKELLEKFKVIKDPKEQRLLICDILNSELSLGDTPFAIRESQVEINNNVLWLKINPAVKNKIFLNKQSYTEKLNSSGVSEKIVDIR